MKRPVLTTLLLLAFILPSMLSAHCEIPCGIYGDKMRIDMLKEHITTIEKSMKQIMDLQKANPINYNQLVRWVTNKEDHANQFQHIVTQYFMTQRIKPVDGTNKSATDKYNKELTLLHEMLVFSMKAKQTTDLSHIKKLNELVKEFYESYFTEEQKAHKH
jgi:nickel superoxide dismutase